MIWNLIVDSIPWWIYPAAAGVVLAVTVQFWSPIWLALPRPVKAAIIGAGAIFGAYIAGRNRGARNERDRRDAANAQANQKRTEIEDEIRNSSDDDLHKRASRWMRDER